MARIGDDTNAFGFGFLTIEVENIEGYNVSKAEVRIGSIIKVIPNPVFPLHLSLNREETMFLSQCGNDCRVAIYDEQDRKMTLKGGLVIPAEPKVV